MAFATDEALRAGGAGFQRAGGWLVNAVGLLLGLGLGFYVRLGFGLLLTWYGLSNWLAWSGSRAPVPPTGPGQYTAHAPSSVPAPSQRGPTIQPVPPVARAPARPQSVTAIGRFKIEPALLPELPLEAAVRSPYSAIPDNPADQPRARPPRIHME